MISNECSLALAKTLNIPIVGYWGFSFHGGEVMYTSVFNPPSLIPGFFSGFSTKMSFVERIVNFVLYLGHDLFMMQQEPILQTLFGRQLRLNKNYRINRNIGLALWQICINLLVQVFHWFEIDLLTEVIKPNISLVVYQTKVVREN